MNDAQTVPARCTTEIVALQKQRTQATPRRFERQHHAVHAATNNNQVVALSSSRRRVAHDRTTPHTSDFRPHRFSGAHTFQRRRQSWKTKSPQST